MLFGINNNMYMYKILYSIDTSSSICQLHLPSLSKSDLKLKTITALQYTFCDTLYDLSAMINYFDIKYHMLSLRIYVVYYECQLQAAWEQH